MGDIMSILKHAKAVFLKVAIAAFLKIIRLSLKVFSSVRFLLRWVQMKGVWSKGYEKWLVVIVYYNHQNA